jgi:hypothetical protein
MERCHTESMTRPSLFWILYCIPVEHVDECIEGGVDAWCCDKAVDCLCYTGLT